MLWQNTNFFDNGKFLEATASLKVTSSLTHSVTHVLKGGSNWLISNGMCTLIFVLWISSEVITTNYSIPTAAAQKQEC